VKGESNDAMLHAESGECPAATRRTIVEDQNRWTSIVFFYATSLKLGHEDPGEPCVENRGVGEALRLREDGHFFTGHACQKQIGVHRFSVDDHCGRQK
jgi:hypothetical protein